MTVRYAHKEKPVGQPSRMILIKKDVTDGNPKNDRLLE